MCHLTDLFTLERQVKKDIRSRKKERGETRKNPLQRDLMEGVEKKGRGRIKKEKRKDKERERERKLRFILSYLSYFVLSHKFSIRTIERARKKR